MIVTESGITFAFSGCTSVTKAFVHSLVYREPLFDRMLHVMDDVMAGEIDWSLRQTLLGIPEDRAIVDLAHNFPLVVALQIAMTAVLRERGILPDAVIGLSAGEVSAAYTAGVISLEDALRIAIHGGRLMECDAVSQRMMMVWRSADEMTRYLEPYAGQLVIGGMMDESVTIITGPQEALQRLRATLMMESAHVLELPFPWGVHTPSISRGREDFEKCLSHLTTSPPVIPIVSTSLGRWAGHATDFSARHWWHLFRSPSRFTAAMDVLIATGSSHYVEIGTEPTMRYFISSLAGRWSPCTDALTINTERRE